MKNEDDDDYEEDVGAAADVDDEGEVKRFQIKVEHFIGFDYRCHFKRKQLLKGIIFPDFVVTTRLLIFVNFCNFIQKMLIFSSVKANLKKCRIAKCMSKICHY